MSLSLSQGTWAVFRRVWFESKCVHTTKHTAVTGKIKYEFKFISAKKEIKKEKHHLNSYLLQFFEQFIRNNIKQQKQGVGMFTPLKKQKTKNCLFVSVLEKKSSVDIL